MNNRKVLAIIPARGGSKRIPGKNIKLFSGKPIISYSIEAALESGCFDEVMVSTDSIEIAKISVGAGAKVPFFRSDKNADDYSIISEVLYEVLNQYKLLGIEFDYFCCIFPTAPFVTGSKLRSALNDLVVSNAKSLISVCQFSFPIFRSLKIVDGKVGYNWPEHKNTRSQDLPLSYHDAGQFVFAGVGEFLKTRQLITDETIPYILPEEEVQDIDTVSDWNLAEHKFRTMKNTHE